MSDQRRVSEIYVNMDKSVLVDSNGSIRTTFMPVFVKSQLLIRCHLQLDDGSVFVAPADAQWVFMIDNSFDPAHNDLVVSDNSQFNISADWASLSVPTGMICWRVDATTTQLIAAMGTDSSKNMTAELWMLPVGGSPTLVVQFPITIKNIVGNVGGDVGLIYTNTNMLKFDGNDIVMLFADGTVAERWSR